MYSPEIVKHFENKPTPDQVTQLAAVVVSFAKQQGKLRESRQQDRTQLFVTDNIEDILSDRDHGYTSQTFIGKVKRHGHGRNRSWSMWLVERFWAIEYDVGEEPGEYRAQGDTSRATYTFRWSPDAVMSASRSLKTKSETEEDDSYLDLGLTTNILDPMTPEPDFLHTIDQMSLVSRADCDLLLKDVKAFANQSRQRLTLQTNQ